MAKKIKLMKEEIQSNYSGGDAYDLIIIGSGITGLSTGLMWLKNVPGKKTLIIEKNPYPGGYVTAYRRGDFVFETTQLVPDVLNVLEYLGIDLNLKQYTGVFMRRMVIDDGKVKEYRLPVGTENLTAYLVSLFPQDAAKIEKFMNYCADMFAQVRKLKALPTLKDMICTPFVAPKVVANLNRTYSSMLDKFEITNTDLREILETFSAFSGVPSDRASAIMGAGAMLSSVTRCFRPYGYYDELPATMTRLFQDWGGEIRLNSKVEDIVVKDGKVTGVKVDGAMIRAEKVVTTIDPMVAMHNLVGDENLPAPYVKRLNGTIMSPSSFNIALGLDEKIDMTKLDLDYPYNVLSTGLGTTEKLFDAFLRGENAFSRDCFHTAVICPSLTTGGRNTVTIRGVPFGMRDWLNWRENDPERYKKEKQYWADFFIDIIEEYVIPDLRKHIEVMDISTPATYSRYSGSPTGSIYDMAALVTQFGPKRLPMKTPIENLYQPKFAHGIYGGMMNGIQVVDLMLNRAFNDGNSLFNPKS